MSRGSSFTVQFSKPTTARDLPLAEYNLPCHFPQLLPSHSWFHFYCIHSRVLAIYTYQGLFPDFNAQDSSKWQNDKMTKVAGLLKPERKMCLIHMEDRAQWWVPYVCPFMTSLLFYFSFISNDQFTVSKGWSYDWRHMAFCSTFHSWEQGQFFALKYQSKAMFFLHWVCNTLFK